MGTAGAVTGVVKATINASRVWIPGRCSTLAVSWGTKRAQGEQLDFLAQNGRERNLVIRQNPLYCHQCHHDAAMIRVIPRADVPSIPIAAHGRRHSCPKDLFAIIMGEAMM